MCLCSVIPSSFGYSECYLSARNRPMSQGDSTTSRLIDSVRLSTLPESTVIQSLVDTYFRHCHFQPYCYFHEANFRCRLAKGDLPPWLLLAVIATTVEFSDADSSKGNRPKRPAASHHLLGNKSTPESSRKRTSLLSVQCKRRTCSLSSILPV